MSKATVMDYFIAALGDYLDSGSAKEIDATYGDELRAIPAYNRFNEAGAGSRELIDAWAIILRHRHCALSYNDHSCHLESLMECAEACASLNR